MKRFFIFFIGVAMTVFGWMSVCHADETSKTELVIRDATSSLGSLNQPRSLVQVVSGVYDASLATFSFAFYQPVGEVEFVVLDAQNQEIATASCDTDIESAVSFFCELEVGADYTITINGASYSGIAYLNW